MLKEIEKGSVQLLPGIFLERMNVNRVYVLK
jgi:hypothetical protein